MSSQLQLLKSPLETVFLSGDQCPISFHLYTSNCTRNKRIYTLAAKPISLFIAFQPLHLADKIRRSKAACGMANKQYGLLPFSSGRHAKVS